MLLVAQYAGIQLWDSAYKNSNAIMAIAFAKDGKMLASGLGSVDLAIRLWDPTTGQCLLQTIKNHTSWITVFTFTEDGKMLASASANGIQLQSTGQCIQKLMGSQSGNPVISSV